MIDKFLPYEKLDEFNKYVNLKISVQTDIKHVSSKSNAGIQAVDFVAGAIHRKYRNDDSKFYDIISEKIDISLNSRKVVFKRVK